MNLERIFESVLREAEEHENVKFKREVHEAFYNGAQAVFCESSEGVEFAFIKKGNRFLCYLDCGFAGCDPNKLSEDEPVCVGSLDQIFNDSKWEGNFNDDFEFGYHCGPSHVIKIV